MASGFSTISSKSHLWLFFFKKKKKWVRSCWVSWQLGLACWPERFWSSRWWTRSPWPAHFRGARVATERAESPAFARGGPTGTSGVGHVPGRVGWRVATVVGLVRADPFRPKSLYGVQTLPRDGFVLISRDFYSCLYNLLLFLSFFLLEIYN